MIWKSRDTWGEEEFEEVDWWWGKVQGCNNSWVEEGGVDWCLLLLLMLLLLLLMLLMLEEVVQHFYWDSLSLVNNANN